ncbi:MAG: RNA 2',3'-cyclic phosphodiesterase [Clostridia bacterium]|nr:RNA 2',3'-cyclic phosphodiesterase [Clostridia bacterium]
MNDSKRLFFGLTLSDAARRAVARAASAVQFDRGRLHPPENYHITLVFLGMTPAEAAPRLLRLGEAAMRKPFELVLAPEMGTFKDGTILWAGVEPSEPLFALQGRLAAMLRENGFPADDAPYRPHITLGRGMRLTAPPPPLEPTAFSVGAVTLFESLRLDGRLVYRPLNEPRKGD